MKRGRGYCKLLCPSERTGETEQEEANDRERVDAQRSNAPPVMHSGLLLSYDFLHCVFCRAGYRSATAKPPVA